MLLLDSVFWNVTLCSGVDRYQVLRALHSFAILGSVEPATQHIFPVDQDHKHLTVRNSSVSHTLFLTDSAPGSLSGALGALTASSR